MTSARRRRIPAGAFLPVVALWGVTACNVVPAEEAGTASADGDAAAVAPARADTTPAIQDAEALEGARLFAAGPDGLLHVREVELPRFSTTRGRAEALVQRIVEESGTFPEEVQVLDVFVSGRGVAVINFTLDLLEGHSGGLHAEELTVYSLSHTLVESLPAIAEVRLLVEGRETETLAGHLDLRSGFGRAPERLLADSDGGRG
ncbi:MAG: GerMN domain-containing protein [Acidobacteriota bacterium]|nr:GerMN domain-containing protein [Acidobacteriota bacterium]